MEIDVREEIAKSQIRPYHCLLALLIGMTVFFVSYGLFNTAYALPYLMNMWRLTPSRAGFLVSSGLIGFTLSSLIQGKFSDRYGRRATLIIALWIISAFSFATAAFARTYLVFCGFRFFIGTGLGVLLPVGVTYINEYAPRRLKNTYSTWGWGLGFSAGGVAAAAVGVFLTPVYGWPSIYYVGSFSVVLVLICHTALPESLQFAALRGQMKGVAIALGRLNPSGASRYSAPDARFVFPESHHRAGSVSLLLSPAYRKATLAIWVAAFIILFAIHGLTSFTPTAMIQRGETFTASFGFGALILAMNFVGTIACGYVADRCSAGRGALVAWWLAGAVSVGVLALVNVHLVNLICTGAAGFFILGGQGALNNLTASWYDTEVRGTAVGMMLGMGHLGGIFGPWISGALQQVSGSALLFVGIASATFIGAIAMMFVDSRQVQASKTIAVSAGHR